LEAVAKQIPGDIKMKAERDFCALDSSQPEVVAMLQMQMIGLLNKHNTIPLGER
jgi:hypothetical protein